MCKGNEEAWKAGESEVKHPEGIALNTVVNVRQPTAKVGNKHRKEWTKLLLRNGPENKLQEEEKSVTNAGLCVNDGGEVANDGAEVGQEESGVGLEEVSKTSESIAPHGKLEVRQLL